MRCCGEMRLWVYGLVRLMCLKYYDSSLYLIKEQFSEKVFDVDNKGHLKIKEEYSLKSYYDKLKKNEESKNIDENTKKENDDGKFFF